MRYLVLASLLLPAGSCLAPEITPEAKPQASAVDGRWKVVRAEQAGKPIDGAYSEEWCFSGGWLTFGFEGSLAQPSRYRATGNEEGRLEFQLPVRGRWTGTYCRNGQRLTLTPDGNDRPVPRAGE